MFKEENCGTDEYILNWNHGFNNGNTKPKIELLIKKKKKKAFLTHCTLSVKVMMRELQFINLYHHS